MTDFDDVSGACEAIAIEVQGTVMQTSDALYDLARAVCDRYWAKFQMKTVARHTSRKTSASLGGLPFRASAPSKWENLHSLAELSPESDWR